MRSEARSGSAQLALLVSSRTALTQIDSILKPGPQTWLQQRRTCGSSRFCLQRCSPPVFTNRSGEGQRSRRMAAGVLAAADLRLEWKPASPLRAAGLRGQGSCVGLILMLRRGRTTVAPRIVPEPLRQRTDSQLLFSLMVFFKPRSHLK